jgi:ABC-type bacteriocin/lantibiotic exporter with double-glycine peptidase domain
MCRYQALARAIYAQKDIVILDDALSGLDATTEKHIFHSLLGRNGLLRRLNSTVLIASSSGKSIRNVDILSALTNLQPSAFPMQITSSHLTRRARSQSKANLKI